MAFMRGALPIPTADSPATPTPSHRRTGASSSSQQQQHHQGGVARTPRRTYRQSAPYSAASRFRKNADGDDELVRRRTYLPSSFGTAAIKNVLSSAWGAVSGTVTETAKWLMPYTAITSFGSWFATRSKKDQYQSMLDFSLMPRTIGSTPRFVKTAQQGLPVNPDQVAAEHSATSGKGASASPEGLTAKEVEYYRGLEKRIKAFSEAGKKAVTFDHPEVSAPKPDDKDEVAFYINKLGDIITGAIGRFSPEATSSVKFTFGSASDEADARMRIVHQQLLIMNQRETIVKAKTNGKLTLQYNDAKRVNEHFRRLQRFEGHPKTSGEFDALLREQEAIIEMQRNLVNNASDAEELVSESHMLAEKRHQVTMNKLKPATKSVGSSFEDHSLPKLEKRVSFKQSPNQGEMVLYVSEGEDDLSDGSPLTIDLSDEEDTPKTLKPVAAPNLSLGLKKLQPQPLTNGQMKQRPLKALGPSTQNQSLNQQFSGSVRVKAKLGKPPSRKLAAKSRINTGAAGSPSNPRIAAPTPMKMRPAEEFHRNMGNRNDDPIRIRFLQEVWGVSLDKLRKSLAKGRLPFFADYNQMLDPRAFAQRKIVPAVQQMPEDIEYLARILGDSSFLARNHIVVNNPFNEFPGMKPLDPRMKDAKIVYVEDEWQQPSPKPVSDLVKTPSKIFHKTHQSDSMPDKKRIKQVWHAETRFDWVFLSPSESTPEDQRELTDEGIDWEISYYDPRIREIPDQASGNRDTTNQQFARKAERAKYSIQDWYRYQLLEEIKKWNKDLAVRYERMDLERKRDQVAHEHWRAVRLVVKSAVEATPRARTIGFKDTVEVRRLNESGNLDKGDRSAFIPMKQPVADEPQKKRKAPGDDLVEVAMAQVDRHERENKDDAPRKKAKHAYDGNETSSYQKSLRDVPKEWRKEHQGTFSAWTEDIEDLGYIDEIDLIDGKLPKGIGRWEKEIAEGKRPRVTIVKSNDEEEPMEVWDLDGTIRPLGWVDPNAVKEAEEAAARKKAEAKRAQAVAAASPKAAASPRASKTTTPSSPFGGAGRTGVAKDADDKPTAPLSPPSSADEFEETGAKVPSTPSTPSAPGESAKERLTSLFQPPPPSPGLRRASSDLAAKSPRSPGLVRSNSGLGMKIPTPTSATAPAFQPLSQSSANSSQQPVSIFSSFASNASETTAGSAGAPASQDENAAPESKEDDANVLRPLSNGTQRKNSVSKSAAALQPSASLLPSPMPSSAANPFSGITAAEMSMFGGAVGGKPSPGDKRPAPDDEFGMELDNTPQSAKRFRSPKVTLGNENAANSIGQQFKPLFNGGNFDFSGGPATTKPSEPFKFGSGVTAPATTGATTGSSSSFVFGAAVAETPKPAVNPAASIFNFGGDSTAKPTEPSSTPFKFGAAAAAPDQTPTKPAASGIFNFGATGGSTLGTSTTPAAKPATIAPQTTSSLFGGTPVATSAPSFSFGGASPLPSGPVFGGAAPAAAPSPIPSAQPAPSIFGAAATKPSEPFSFGAASNTATTSAAAPASLFGSQPATTAPAAASSFTFGASTTSAAPAAPSFTAPTSSSFTFGATSSPALKPAQPALFGAASTAAPVSASFGASSPAPSTAAGFSFSTAAPVAKPPVTSGFSFGTASPAPGSPAPTPAFFGGGGVGTPSAPAGGAAPDGGEFNFGFQATPNKPAGGTLGRNIKKPVSRLAKGGSLRR